MFTEQSFAVYVLDDYSVLLMPEVRQALFKKGYMFLLLLVMTSQAIFKSMTQTVIAI